MAMDPLTVTSPPATIAANPTNIDATLSVPTGGTAKEDRPDYTCEAYQEMLPYWTLCDDVEAGTKRLRDKAADYLPRFEAESLKDWEARLSMTFVDDHYAQTLEDLVGMVCAEDVALDPKTAPKQILEYMDDVDGEGNALAVFARELLNDAIDEGHAAIYTDYPNTPALRDALQRDLTLADVRERNLRPYWAKYKASDILSWRYAKMGSVYVLTKVVLRERVTQNVGLYGSTTVHQYRIVEQATVLDAREQVVSLGPISFTVKQKAESTNPKSDFIIVEEGKIQGPKQIPLRIVYGGKKLGRMHSRPFLIGLAMTNVEEAQVKSDYAAVMHKCNIPTPVFIGRRPDANGQMAEIQMGQGIDISQGGDAKMLEPSGAALTATRDRLGDIRLQLRRQGATLELDDQRRRQLTATEASINAAQRNAKLGKAARSLRDALEGAGGDMAAFENVPLPKGGKLGFIVNTDFSSGSFDPIFVAACHDAFVADALPLEDYLYVLKHGELPDDFDAEAVAAIQLMAQIARQKAEQDAAAGDETSGGDPNSTNNAGGTTNGNAGDGKPPAAAAA